MIAQLLLLGAGLAAGFVAGLIGVGGGIIFAPVLFFYFQYIGVAPEVLAPMTIGSSLFCTLLASLASAWYHYRKGAVIKSVAWRVGVFSAVAIFLMTRFVTTQPWYDGGVFQVVFSLLLIAVVIRMVRGRRGEAQSRAEVKAAAKDGWGSAAIGTAAGLIAAAAGVGGGIVLVPAYHTLMRMSMHLATGTSSATIIVIALVGVLNYGSLGWSAPVPGWGLGYVDVQHALLLAVPSMFSARLGVWTAHRVNTQALRWSFAAIALIVAVRMLMGSIG